MKVKGLFILDCPTFILFHILLNTGFTIYIFYGFTLHALASRAYCTEFRISSIFLKKLPQIDNCINVNHCVKSVQIRSYFWSLFSCIRTEYSVIRYSVSLRIQSEYRKIRTRNNSVFGQFSRSEYFVEETANSLSLYFLFIAVFKKNSFSREFWL